MSIPQIEMSDAASSLARTASPAPVPAAERVQRPGFFDDLRLQDTSVLNHKFVEDVSPSADGRERVAHGVSGRFVSPSLTPIPVSRSGGRGGEGCWLVVAKARSKAAQEGNIRVPVRPAQRDSAAVLVRIILTMSALEMRFHLCCTDSWGLDERETSFWRSLTKVESLTR